MNILRFSSYVPLIYCAVSSICAAPSQYTFYTVEDGYIKEGADLAVASMNVSQAEELCTKLEGCKSFYHHGGINANNIFEMHFRGWNSPTVMYDDKYTTYVLRIGCTRTSFDHCPADENVRCCDAEMDPPQCGKRSQCEELAKEMHCFDSDASRCPYFGDSQCCASNGRCIVTDDCSKHQAQTYSTLVIVLIASTISLGLILVLVSIIACQWNRNRKDAGGIVPGCVVTYHDSRQALLGVVGDWDSGHGMWEVRLRSGRVVHATAANLLRVSTTGSLADGDPSASEQPSSEMAQRPKDSIYSTNLSFHNSGCEELGTWECDGCSFQIDIGDDAQIVFAQGAVKATLLRESEWLEGDLVSSDTDALVGETRRVRLKFIGKVKALGKDELLLNYKNGDECEWSDTDTIAVRRSFK